METDGELFARAMFLTHGELSQAKHDELAAARQEILGRGYLETNSIVMIIDNKLQS